MRLIDADALDGKLIPNCPIEEGGIPLKDFATHKKILKLYPTIDAVPVVRCKDCVHWYDREGVCLKIYSDGNVSADAWQERKPDDFCSYGERKDGECDAQTE